MHLRRPWSVLVAAIGWLVSLALYHLFLYVTKGPIADNETLFSESAITLALASLSLFLFWRNNWAKWPIFVLSGLGALLAIPNALERPEGEALFFLGQGALQLAVCICLVLPSSTRWFHATETRAGGGV